MKQLKMKQNKKKGGFLGMLLSILVDSLLENMLAGKRVVRRSCRVIRAGQRVIRAGKGQDL